MFAVHLIDVAIGLLELRCVGDGSYNAAMYYS